MFVVCAETGVHERKPEIYAGDGVGRHAVRKLRADIEPLVLRLGDRGRVDRLCWSYRDENRQAFVESGPGSGSRYTCRQPPITVPVRSLV